MAFVPDAELMRSLFQEMVESPLVLRDSDLILPNYFSDDYFSDDEESVHSGYDDDLDNFIIANEQRVLDCILSTGPSATEALEDEEVCYVCLQNKPDSVFDCGNSGVCCVCANVLVNTTRKCPLCRQTVESFNIVH